MYLHIAGQRSCLSSPKDLFVRVHFARVLKNEGYRGAEELEVRVKEPSVKLTSSLPGRPGCCYGQENQGAFCEW